MKKLIYSTLLLFSVVVIATGCKKEKENIIPEPAAYSDVNFKMDYSVDAMPLYFDSMIYTNAAGNKYSVTKIHYYLSRLKLYAKGVLKYSSNDIFYLDAASANYAGFKLKNVPALQYDSVSFNIGLDEAQNISNSLPASNENIVMAWPDMMGGGYHFLKLEGHWQDSNGNAGYAMHIGKNGFHIQTGVKSIFNLQPGMVLNLKMKMNVNEWFTTPNMYDLANDGVYSMGNEALMRKLSENGRDVFTIEYQ